MDQNLETSYHSYDRVRSNKTFFVFLKKPRFLAVNRLVCQLAQAYQLSRLRLFSSISIGFVAIQLQTPRVSILDRITYCRFLLNAFYPLRSEEKAIFVESNVVPNSSEC